MAAHSSVPTWKNSKDRGAQWATVHRVVEESDTTEHKSYSMKSFLEY